MRVMMWFRSDLRTRDNTALHHACRDADNGVVAVFTLTPKQWQEHDWGNPKVEFLLRNLRDLAATLKEKNIPFLIPSVDTFDDVPGHLLKLAERHDCDALYFNDEYEWNERQRDKAVRHRFQEHDRKVESFTDQVILAPGEVLTKDGGTYSVYTPFMRAWVDTVDTDGDLEVLPAPGPQDDLNIASDEAPGSVKGFDTSDSREALWQAGEDHAGYRLDAFIDNRLADYRNRRDAPAVNGTSTLSPYLALGVLSPRQCFKAARRANNNRISGIKGKERNGAETWMSELIWREFYRHILVGYPRVSKGQPFQEKTKALRWRDDEEGFRAWCEGRTGYPIVDAAMRQLNQTGWMHNRLRMITAMFLTKDLLIDWRKGEAYFMQRLVDGDLANNNGGWQWSASTGTDAAPYFRIYNPSTQGARHDPEGTFIRQVLPELAGVPTKLLHDPVKLQKEADVDYPEPIVDHAEARERALEAFKAL